MSDDGPEIKEWDPEWMVRRGNHITLVTPELAAEWLGERNTNNRKTKEAAIVRYAREMLAGRWDPDASDIKFSRTGELIDGQNRLHACIRSGVAFPSMVRTGLGLDTKRRVDIGVRRTVADTFTMERVTDANHVAAGIALRLRYEDAEANGWLLNASPTRGARTIQLSPDAALDYLRKHPEHEKMGGIATRMYRMGPGMPRTVYHAFLAMAASQDESDAMRFADEYLSAEWPAGSPIMALMRYLASLAPGPRGSVVRLRNASERHLTALILVWNAWRMEEPLPKVVVRDTDPFIPLV